MILTVDELRKYIDTDESDDVLEVRLLAVELLIRAYTHNNFQDRGYRTEADIHGGLFVVEELTPFEAGDTVQVSASEYNDGLYTVKSVDDAVFTVREHVRDEMDVLVTKVVYPEDVKLGAVNLLKWEASNREKVGVASETISRHAVTYFDQSSGNTKMGYPVSLLGFLEPYKCARFGQGVKL
ncbi:MAG: hypothetical protein ACI4WX_06185 [Aristaeellaceae bacterium]